jgi:hypothetical protein
MKKNIITDVKTNKGKITMITRKDIVDTAERTIPRTSSRKTSGSRRATTDVPLPIPKAPKRLRSTPTLRQRRPLMRRKFFSMLLLCLFLGAVFFVSNAFENVRISVIHKHAVFPLASEAFTASRDPASPIRFDIMIVSDQMQKDMTLTQSANVSLKAHAQVTLYNTYSTKPQTILAGTLVADPDGKTYKLDASVKIPGYTVSPTDKTQIIAGTAQGSITAFLPGAAYNSTQTDFTITSFKGTSKATKLYLTATTPVSGGAQGLVYMPTANDQGVLDATAQTTFKSMMLKKVAAQVPPGYILYPDTSTFSYTIDTSVQSPTPDAHITISGTASAVILNQKDLSEAILKRVAPTLTDQEYAEISIPDIANLTFAFSPQGQIITKDMQSVSFTLSGNVTADWNPNITLLTTRLLGAPHKSVSPILATDPGISRATVKFFPPWKSRLPLDPAKIHFLVN